MYKTNGKTLRRIICAITCGAVLMTSTNTYATNVQPLSGYTAGVANTDSVESVDETQENITTNELNLTAGAATTVEVAGENADEIDLGPEIVMANVENSVNVRAEANEEAEAVGKLFADCGGEIIEQAEGWTKLVSGNVEGWVKNEYLLFDEEADAKRSEVGALKATVETDALRVRKEASEDADVYTLVKQGDTLEAVSEEAVDGWLEVVIDDDTTGYIAAEYVTVAFTVDTGKTNKEIADEERAKELAKLSKNQGAVPTSVSDVTLLAALIQCEAGTQPYEGKLAVGAAVMNRVRSGAYPNSIIGVITAPGQFPPATDGKVSAVVARGPSASCMEAAQAAVNGATNIGGACHFGRVGKAPGIVIGAHVFY